jgi:Fe-S oxidoreductase
MVPTNEWWARLILILALAISIGWTAFRINQLYSFVRLGRVENRFDRLNQRIALFNTNVLGQFRLWKRYTPAGVAHALTFWGFLIVQVGLLDFLIAGLVPGWRLPILGGSPPLLFLLDIFQFLVLIAIVSFFYRRLVTKPERFSNDAQAWIILGLIALLMITLFVVGATEIVADYTQSPFNAAQYPWIMRPFSSLLALGFQALGLGESGARGVLMAIHDGAWWVHIFTVLSFLPYLGYSKHLHLFTAPLNVFFYDLRPKGQMELIPELETKIENEEPVGVNKIEDMRQKDIIDLYTCTECGRCQDACPAWQTDKPLSPKKLILDLQHHVLTAGPAAVASHRRQPAAAETAGSGVTLAQAAAELRMPLAGGVIMDEKLRSCTTSRACMTACPVFIEHVPKITDMRRYLVMQEGRIPDELNRTFRNLEQNGNPWQFNNSRRADWAQGLDIAEVADVEDVSGLEVVWWVGCLQSFDQRSQKTARALAAIFQQANVKFAIMGKSESCCGDPARRPGNEYLYQVLAQTNIETMNELKVTKLVTACPHCFNTIKNEYPQLGGNYEVLHHTEFIDYLIKAGRLKLGTAVEQTITYHDPCYIGRYNDIYDAPRAILEAIPGVTVVEMARTRDNALCCGAGGGRMWLEERNGRRMNQNRIGDVEATGAGTLAAACPFCTSMFTDGIKGKGREADIKLLDLAELVEASMVRNGGVAIMDASAGGGTAAANAVGDVDATPPIETPGLHDQA